MDEDKVMYYKCVYCSESRFDDWYWTEFEQDGNTIVAYHLTSDGFDRVIEYPNEMDTLRELGSYSPVDADWELVTISEEEFRWQQIK